VLFADSIHQTAILIPSPCSSGQNEDAARHHGPKVLFSGFSLPKADTSIAHNRDEMTPAVPVPAGQAGRATSGGAKKTCCQTARFHLFIPANAPDWCRGKPVLPRFTLKMYKKDKLSLEELMKFNKWTLGLAAVGVVSLASAVKADEAAPANTVLTSLSSTTISGYVDTSAQWNFGTGNANNPNYFGNNANKADGFNLNVVDVTIAKPLDASQWAAGYHIELWMGPDAAALGTQSTGGASDFAIRQAYVELRTPVGNGIDWKIGVFDTIVGYESLSSPSNPNYTHSYGFSMEPTTHTGVLGTYQFCDEVSASLGVANTFGPQINQRAMNQGTPFPPVGTYNQAETYKTYMGDIALTAPDSWGFLKGSTLYGGVINGYNAGVAAGQTTWYAGATINTPVTGWKLGVSYDYEGISSQPLANGTPHVYYNANYANAVGLYSTFQATEKLSLNLRGEYASSDAYYLMTAQVFDVTATLQYELWKNVVSRVEFRWDHDASDSNAFGGNIYGVGTRDNAFMLAANVIYKF
jgi:hypothetical protein